MKNVRWQLSIAAFIAVLAMFVIASKTPSASSNGATTNSSPSDSASITPSKKALDPLKPTATPAPTEKPESYQQQRAREKREFIYSLSPSITADKISGNPTKYEGANVELHCTVSGVPQEGIVNASCGEDQINIVLKYDDTSSLDQGQVIRVLGTVDEPAEGTNAFGGAMNFPTVDVKFME